MKFDKVRVRVAVQNFKSLGHTKAEVMRMLGKSQHFVDRWWDDDSAEDKEKGHRHQMFTRTVKSNIIKRLHDSKRPHSKRIVAREMRCSHSTIGRIAKEAGLKSVVAHWHPFLKPEQEAARRKFAKDHANEDWTAVLFVGEKKVGLHPTSNKQNDRVWIYDGEEPPGRHHDRHSAELNVSAGISFSGRSSIFIFSDNMDQVLYKHILEDTLRPAGKKLEVRGWKLYQDNDPKYKSKVVQNFLDEQRVVRLLAPAKSPDLNPIENVWSMLDTEVQKCRPTNLASLQNAIIKGWKNIPQKSIQNCIMSMPTRLALVKKAQGKAIHF
jgi:hypothetical protein